MEESVLGVVLAGGESRRLGRDKATAMVGGVSLLERAFGVLSGLFQKVVVSIGPGSTLEGGFRVVCDLRPGSGPIAALEAVLESESDAPIFVLACDLPLVDERVVRRILVAAGGGAPGRRPSAWVARDCEVIQPLCGLYTPDCLPVVRSQIDRGRLGLMELLERIEYTEVEVGDLGAEILLNVNRETDLARARELTSGR